MSERIRLGQALPFVLVTVFIDTVGMGIIVPVVPELIMELTGEGLSEAASYGGLLMFVYALMQFLCAPLVGNLSDRFGRRPVLLLSLFALGLDYILMALAPQILWLFVGRFLAGMFGATTTTANAFVADVSPPEKRAQNFGLIGAIWGLGFMMGPVIGGLLGELGPRVPFYGAAGLALLNVTYGVIALPETLPPEMRRPFSWARANMLGALRSMRVYPIVIALMAVLILNQIAHDANPSRWTYYTMLKFGWSERDVGLSVGLVGLMVAIVSGIVTRLVIPKTGEARAVVIGLLGGGLGFLGFAFAGSGVMMYAFILPWSLIGLAGPALTAILSNEVAANMQGELQGAITSLRSLTAIVAPLLMTQLFRFFTASDATIYFPGAPFFTAGLMIITSVLVFTVVMRRAWA